MRSVAQNHIPCREDTDSESDGATTSRLSIPATGHKYTDSGPEFTHDLVEYVIDELHDDRAALQACNLTSRSWSHRARTHLHRSFTLEHTHASLASIKSYSRYKVLEDLPAILRYADEVSLKSVPSESCESRDEGSCSAQFWHTIQQLQHVRKVRIIDMDFPGTFPRNLGSSDPRHWGTLFPAVEALSLVNTTFLDSHDLLLLMSEFPHLDVLKLEKVKFGSMRRVSCAQGEITGVSRPVPRSVHIDCHDRPEIALQVLRYIHVSKTPGRNLEMLRLVTTLGVEESDNTTPLIREAGSTLQGLHLVLQQHFEHPRSLSNMREEVLYKASRWIESCISLTVLRLEFRRDPAFSMLSVIYGREKYPFSTIWEIWGEVLKGITKVSFRRLVFYVDARDIDNREALENVLLTHSPLHSLESLCFFVGGHFTSDRRMKHAYNKWIGAIQRLKSQYTVQLEFYHWQTEAIKERWYIW